MSIEKLELPKYETTLPMSGQKVSYRPYTVREEKILLIAQEEDDVDGFIVAIDTIIKECTFNNFNIDNINKVDAEYLFVSIRNKATGGVVDVNGICKDCSGKTLITLNLDEMSVKNKDTSMEVKISDDLWFNMRIPTIHESMSLAGKDGYAAIAICIDNIIKNESSINFHEYSLEDRIDWVESLPPIQLKELHEFFQSVPVLQMDHEYKCFHCEYENSIHIEGIESFFE